MGERFPDDPRPPPEEIFLAAGLWGLFVLVLLAVSRALS